MVSPSENTGRPRATGRVPATVALSCGLSNSGDATGEVALAGALLTGAPLPGAPAGGVLDGAVPAAGGPVVGLVVGNAVAGVQLAAGEVCARGTADTVEGLCCPMAEDGGPAAEDGVGDAWDVVATEALVPPAVFETVFLRWRSR